MNVNSSDDERFFVDFTKITFIKKFTKKNLYCSKFNNKKKGQNFLMIKIRLTLFDSVLLLMIIIIELFSSLLLYKT